MQVYLKGIQNAKRIRIRMQRGLRGGKHPVNNFQGKGISTDIGKYHTARCIIRIVDIHIVFNGIVTCLVECDKRFNVSIFQNRQRNIVHQLVCRSIYSENRIVVREIQAVKIVLPIRHHCPIIFNGTDNRCRRIGIFVGCNRKLVLLFYSRRNICGTRFGTHRQYRFLQRPEIHLVGCIHQQAVADSVAICVMVAATVILVHLDTHLIQSVLFALEIHFQRIAMDIFQIHVSTGRVRNASRTCYRCRVPFEGH